MLTRMHRGPRGTGGHSRINRRTGSLTAALIALAALALMPAGAAATEEGVVAFPGSPLSVFVGQRGECQSSYPVTGVNYFINEKGDCGFFLAFPKDEANKQPTFLQEKVFGFYGTAGPHLSNSYTPISQSPVTGEGTGASPYTETTVYDVTQEGEEGKVEATFAKVTDTTTYVTGAPQFNQTFTVKNEATTRLYFRALYAGDLYVAGDDFGTGSFLGGPPRFIGGENIGEGILGGFIESTPWSAWEEGCWNETAFEGEGGRCTGAAAGDKGIWATVRDSASTEIGAVFDDEADPASIDNAAGVEWDEDLTTGLTPKAEASFTVINHTEAPAGLSVSPGSQTLTQGQTATVTVKAVNTADKPYAGAKLDYSITGANPQSGTVVLNAAGEAQISYVGHNPGVDTDQMFLDLAGTGVQTATDPSATATATFVPLPPTPNSTYTVQSIHANANGTITITFVPTQAGTATLEVTVPTGTIASRAIAAKSKKCKRGKVRIKGKCLPPSTVTGKVSVSGQAGIALKITLAPSGKVRAALKKGKTVTLTATLTYRSALGGTPTVESFHFKVKPKRKH